MFAFFADYKYVCGWSLKSSGGNHRIEADSDIETSQADWSSIISTVVSSASVWFQFLYGVAIGLKH